MCGFSLRVINSVAVAARVQSRAECPRIDAASTLLILQGVEGEYLLLNLSDSHFLIFIGLSRLRGTTRLRSRHFDIKVCDAVA